MKKRLSYIIILLVVSIIVLMSKNFINISYLSAPATLESTRILLCNIDYEVKVENENIKNIQTIFNSINYNLNNDNFPKPGSGNKIYNGMSEVEQNIKYNLRPNAIVKEICQQLPKDVNGLSFENLVKEKNTFSLTINRNISVILNLQTQDVLVNPNLNDPSGMGGYYVFMESNK